MAAKIKVNKSCKDCGTNETIKWHKDRCHKCYGREYYQNNKQVIKDKHKLQSNNNKVLIKDINKNWYSNNKYKEKEYKKAYVKKNKEKIATRQRRYYEINKEEIKKRTSKNSAKRYKNNVNFKLSHILRTRLTAAIKNNNKSGSAVRDLGCSIGELKEYLELKFVHGMTWNNHSRDGWHIDLIKPLSSFSL